MPIQATIIVSGTVQSVGYREDVHRQAVRRGLTGLVQNIDDGKVQIVVEGERETIDDFIAAISISDRLAEVTDVTVEFSESKGCFSSFIVARDMRRNGLPETKLEEGIGYLKQIANGIQMIHTDLGDKLDKMDTHMGERFDRLDLKYDKFSDKLEGFDNKFDVLGDKLDVISEELLEFRSIAGDIRELKGLFATFVTHFIAKDGVKT